MSPTLRDFADAGLDPSDFYPDGADDWAQMDAHFAEQAWVERLIEAAEGEGDA